MIRPILAVIKHVNLFTVIVLFVAGNANGQSICVTTSMDVVNDADGFLSLREAIDSANQQPGLDTICFDPMINGDHIVLNLASSNEDNNADGDLDITDEDGLVIWGNGENNTIVDGDSTERVFDHFAGDLMINDLTIQNGFFTSNSNISSGGAGVRSTPTDPVDIGLNNCTFLACHSKFRGGAFYLFNDQTDLIHLELNGCSFLFNTAESFLFTANGGAIHLDAENVQADIVQCAFTDNQADGGGAIHLEKTRSMLIENSAFNRNNSGVNHAKNGGAIEISGGSQNTQIINSQLDSNSAENGGAIHISGSGHILTIKNSAIINNMANINGGGIYSNSDASVYLTNSTLSGNLANKHGGGLSVNGSENVLLNFVTITNNIANDNDNGVGDGGGLDMQGMDAPDVLIQNSIVQGNDEKGASAHDDCSNNSTGNLLSLGKNIFGNGTGCPVTGMDNTGDAMLDSLENYGGTTLTHRIKTGSAAIDFATCGIITKDQRGYFRDDGFCDAGAFEVSEIDMSNIIVTTETDTVDGDTSSIINLTSDPGSDGKISLREAVTAANHTIGMDTIRFDAGLNGDTILLNMPSTDEDLNKNGDLDLIDSDGLVILGNGLAQTILDGAQDGRIIDVLRGDLQVYGLTFQQGLENMGDGGGINCSPTSIAQLIIDSCLFQGNVVSGDNSRDGGALNTSGAIRNVWITNSVFNLNTAMGQGGAMHLNANQDSLHIKISSTQITNNQAFVYQGGGLVYEEEYLFEMDHCLIQGNSAGDDGGGIAFRGGDRTTTLSHCSVDNNQAGGQGGGIQYDFTGSIGAYLDMVKHSTISNNFAGSNGGGISFESNLRSLQVQNSTISGNNANEDGGGIAFSSSNSSNANFDFVTITNNQADFDNTEPGDGGGINFSVNNFTFTVANSILQGNIDNSTPTNDDFGDAGSVSFVIENNGGNVFGMATGCPVGPDDTTGLALLGTLTDNGGLTSTHALLVGSAAIDFAVCDTFSSDQRDFPRNDGACDAGAFEALETELINVLEVTTELDSLDGDTSSLANLFNSPGADGKISLREAITATNHTAGLDTINFNIAGAGIHTILINEDLPSIVDPVVIDGLSQPGASCNSWPPILQIQINGDSMATNGFRIVKDAAGSTIRGLVVDQFIQSAVMIDSSSSNFIECNFLGTEASGSNSSGRQEIGIYILNGSMNMIGGEDIAKRNLISGNLFNGLLIDGGANNMVFGNFIGTDVTGVNPLGNAETGIFVYESTNNQIGSGLGKNIISGNGNPDCPFCPGIHLNRADSNVIQGNYIGIDSAGTIAIGNSGDGIFLQRSSFNILGGGNAVLRNVISGNGFNSDIEADGISFENDSDCNRVWGNYLGTDVSGLQSLGNADDGLDIGDSKNNQVGGIEAGQGNIISGNLEDGVTIFDGADSNLVIGNLVGLGTDTMTGIGNARFGVDIRGNSNNNQIGGWSSSEGNQIAFSDSSGIIVLDLGGNQNLIAGNNIFNNGLLGIDLSAGENSDGITANDIMDPDQGSNNFQNYPVLDSAMLLNNQITVVGSINSLPDTIIYLEFFANIACNSSTDGISTPFDSLRFGEGQYPLGWDSITTNGSGDASFEFILDFDLTDSVWVTATATIGRNTSEFSRCVFVEGSNDLVRTWTGLVSNDWSNPLNWSPNFIPTEEDNVFIPDVNTNDPIVFNTIQALAKKIVLDAGAKLTIQNGGTLSLPWLAEDILEIVLSGELIVELGGILEAN